MNISFAPHFKERLEKLPKEIQHKFEKQTAFLLNNIRYPSLQAKRYSGIKDLWQARIDKEYRFYFLIEQSTYYLVDIRKHTSG